MWQFWQRGCCSTRCPTENAARPSARFFSPAEVASAERFAEGCVELAAHATIVAPTTRTSARIAKEIRSTRDITDLPSRDPQRKAALALAGQAEQRVRDRGRDRREI